ncbi:MAG TPA: hypothetical protein VF911_18745, partial [Thermoanaerobaculia bacterium]
ARTPTTTAAVMNSTLTGYYGLNLQSWDRSAAASAYGATTTTTPTCAAPAIAAQPLSRTIRYGTTTALTVTASGTGLKYQWYRGATGVNTYPIAGATAATYTTPALTATTSYWVAVTGTCGVVNSRTVTVSICTAAPSIATQPLSQTIARGTAATLSVTASGVGPFTYEWYQGTAGDTTRRVGSAQSFRTPLLTTSTYYWVRVRNACGYVNSRTALITAR